MKAFRAVILSGSLGLCIIGCHQPDQRGGIGPAVGPAPTAAADRTQMRSDAATAQATMQSDAAALSAATAPGEAAGPAQIVAVARITPSKSATTLPANNNVSGIVSFTQQAGGVLVVADISGLEPNTRHGIHIHERGDLSDPNLMSTGGHWNPDHHPHGGPSTSPVHAGDLGNLDADAMGHAHLELLLTDVSVGGPKNDVIGHAVIIHARADDLSSQPSGNAGARIAGGIIELQLPK